MYENVLKSELKFRFVVCYPQGRDAANQNSLLRHYFEVGRAQMWYNETAFVANLRNYRSLLNLLHT